MGLTSEHFKLAGLELAEFLTCTLNYMISTKTFSYSKEGHTELSLRKGDPTNPGNNRGITVRPVLLKILEHVINTRHNHIFAPTQSRIQNVFNPGCSALNVAIPAFILSKCILKAANSKYVTNTVNKLFVPVLNY